MKLAFPGLNAAKQQQKKIDLLVQASQQNDPVSKFQLGKQYLEEKSSSSTAKAKQYLRDSAKLKYAPAFYYLGLMYENGYYGDSKTQEAIKCYRGAIKYENKINHM